MLASMWATDASLFMSSSLPMRPEGYDSFLEELKQRIRTAQVKAALAVNRELVLLYWQIGREILERQDRAGWGAKYRAFSCGLA